MSFQYLQRINEECAKTGENPRLHVSEKILNRCLWAESHGFKLLWCDTCCINHNSSAELSEAINSMYAWYKEATVCYAYLYDVTDDERLEASHSSFRQSLWLTRGWTLQEPFAPKAVVFLTQLWIPIASKRPIRALLKDITGIDAGVLIGTMSLDEDEAYCLMGIFGVHLPTIYGEGKDAFIRLQEEIMLRIPDTTLLAWGPRGTPADRMLGHRSAYPTASGVQYVDSSCLLASSPAALAGVTDLIDVPRRVHALAYRISSHEVRFSMSSHGIQAVCPIIYFSNVCGLLVLPCCRAYDEESPHFALFLRFRSDTAPWCIGAKVFTERVVQYYNLLGSPRSIPLVNFSRSTSHQDVRCVMVPTGFDFSACIQRPVCRQEFPIRPRWERVYVAYRKQHIILLDHTDPHAHLSPYPALIRPSRAAYYKLFFHTWVISDLEAQGFVVPTLAHDPAPGLAVGDQLTILFFDRRARMEMRLVLRAEPAILTFSYADDALVASLWCALLLPSEGAHSLDGQMSAIYSELENGSTDTDERDADDFVDFWLYGGHKGRKVFFDGRWRIVLTFSRLIELSDAARKADMDLCDVYVVDIRVNGNDMCGT
ncbi:hypothetical protein BD413DRAFT_610504 [Trametes elegans]|nr:hypothetical protein BD413DRAFT_610504 [Trametes elegans]